MAIPLQREESAPVSPSMFRDGSRPSVQYVFAPVFRWEHLRSETTDDHEHHCADHHPESEKCCSSHACHDVVLLPVQNVGAVGPHSVYDVPLRRLHVFCRSSVADHLFNGPDVHSGIGRFTAYTVLAGQESLQFTIRSCPFDDEGKPWISNRFQYRTQGRRDRRKSG